jgi:hypothetical protein
MKAYKIRNAKGAKLTETQLEELATRLQRALAKRGFITGCERIGLSGVKIGLGGKCFTIDTDRHGYNGRWLPAWQQVIPGVDYKRTNLPTWCERVQFNEVVNDVFDAFKLSATIKSGLYTVRDGTKARTEDDWYDDAANQKQGHYSVDASDTIVKLTDDELQAMQNARKAYRREQARERRKAEENRIIDALVSRDELKYEGE